MSKQKILKTLKDYQKSPLRKQEKFWRAFEEKMIYRTTKTENPQTTKAMVKKILNKGYNNK